VREERGKYRELGEVGACGEARCGFKDTGRARFKSGLNHGADDHDQLHIQGEAIMRLWFDCDLGSLAVLMIGIGGVAFLAMSI
jgi:hypothetical protein